MLKIKVFVFLWLALCVSGYMKEKPSWLPTCIFKDKDYTKCSTNSTSHMFIALRKGLPEIGVPSIEPFQIDKIQIAQSDTGPMRLSCSLRNVTISGLSDVKVLYNKVDNVTHDCTTKVHVDTLEIRGKYDMDGQLLFLPLQGTGDCWFKVSNISIFAHMDANLMKKHGHYFYNLTKIQVKFDFTGLDLYLDNLFNGAEELEKRTNQLFNSNWKPFAEVMMPTLTHTIEEILFHIMKRIFDGIPADYWVSDIGETYKPPKSP